MVVYPFKFEQLLKQCHSSSIAAKSWFYRGSHGICHVIMRAGTDGRPNVCIGAGHTVDAELLTPWWYVPSTFKLLTCYFLGCEFQYFPV